MKRKMNTYIKVRKDLIPGKKYGSETFTDEMGIYLGKKAKIVSYTENSLGSENSAYLLDIDQGFWTWSEEMVSDYLQITNAERIPSPITNPKEFAQYSVRKILFSGNTPQWITSDGHVLHSEKEAIEHELHWLKTIVDE